MLIEFTEDVQFMSTQFKKGAKVDIAEDDAKQLINLKHAKAYVSELEEEPVKKKEK